MKNFQKSIVIFISGLSLIIIGLFLSFGFVERHFLRELAVQNDSTIRLVASGLSGALKRFEPLPVLLADKTDMKWLLASNGDQTHVNHVNLELKKIAKNLGASDIYVLDKNAVTISSSNFDSDASFIGKDFNYRPYFYEAFSGKPAQFYALGTTSLKRGYYFAAPIVVNDEILGVIAVKIGVDSFEENWGGTDRKIFVSDKNGVIFMASEPKWRFKSLHPLSEQSLLEIERTKQFPINQLAQMDINTVSSASDEFRLTTIGEGEEADSYLESRQSIASAGWTLHVLAPRSSATTQTYITLAIAFLFLSLCLMIAAAIIQRRAHLIKNIELQKRTQEELESRVAERTYELNLTNRKLTREVKERTQTENRLRTTQNELIQAGKLAALGQMSASLSHELNQPLSAVKSYADNARKYLQRDNINKAATNIEHISQMVDRMAELGQHLRNFARKPQQKIDVVELSEVFRSVDQIMSARIKEANAQLQLEPFNGALMVQGGQVRLQQVMVNLVNNALDAMHETSQPLVIVSVHEDVGRVEIRVRDHGHGIDDKIIDKIFDPFFTTKKINEGVGLGLSISYNIIQDFGGTLSAYNHSDGGAVFAISLEGVTSIQKAAE
ncbi:MAG: ATP-binding protein [Hyphomicrobiales bacterium]